MDRLDLIKILEQVDLQVDAIEYIVGETSQNAENAKIANGLYHAVVNCTNEIVRLNKSLEDGINATNRLNKR